jgi:hypothetical protein
MTEQQVCELLGVKHASDIQQKIYNGHRHLINASDIINVIRFLNENGFTVTKL